MADKPFIVMLDLDGPICTFRALNGLRDWFDPVAAGMLARFCDETGSRIVIVSARRRDEGLREKLDDLGLGVHLFDHPEHWRTGHDRMAVRGNEVDAWLSDNPGHDRWAIVDDERGGYAPHHVARLVHTGMHAGLQMRDLALLRAYFGLERMSDPDQVDQQHPRITIANTIAQALAALDEGDEDAARALLAIAAQHPLAQ